MEAAEAENLRIQESYTKERKVGEGTYASVYEGHQKKTGRKIAIKKIKARHRPIPLMTREVDMKRSTGWPVQRWTGHVGDPRGQVPSGAQAS